jgi:hypothetical protein
MYILSSKALSVIDDKRPAIISKLALSLNCTEASINRYIKDNEPNGDLTKVAVIDVLREEFGVFEGQILKKVSINAVAK